MHRGRHVLSRAVSAAKRNEEVENGDWVRPLCEAEMLHVFSCEFQAVG